MDGYTKPIHFNFFFFKKAKIDLCFYSRLQGFLCLALITELVLSYHGKIVGIFLESLFHIISLGNPSCKNSLTLLKQCSGQAQGNATLWQLCETPCFAAHHTICLQLDPRVASNTF